MLGFCLWNVETSLCFPFGFHTWLKRAPKIIKELCKSGEIISERTVGKYMKQMILKLSGCKSILRLRLNGGAKVLFN